MAEVSKRRIVFMGTPSFAANILNTLLDSENYEIAAIYTQPDKKAGRGMKTAFSEVKKIALNHNLPLYKPDAVSGRSPCLSGRYFVYWAV